MVLIPASLRRLALGSAALVLGTFAGSPVEARGLIEMPPCVATAGGITFAFEPGVFAGTGSQWVLYRNAGAFFYASGGLDSTKAKPGKPVKLRDKSNIAEFKAQPNPQVVKAKLRATITPGADDFDVQVKLTDKTNDRTVTLTATGSCGP